MRSLSNPIVHKAIAFIALAAFAVQIIRFYIRPGLPKPWTLTDYDIFHLAGTLALNGGYEQAYSRSTFLPFHKAFSGVDSFLTWTYPPQFELVVAPLASLDITLGYILFVGATLGAYIYALCKLSGEQAGVIFTILFPSILLTILTGQNGFLTAALIGMSCALLLAGSPWAGATLGLMAVKPHLAVTLGVHAVVSGNWRVVAIAAATVIATSLAATLVFGPQVWFAFLGSVREAQAYLELAAYPIHRMVSVYATLRSIGMSADAAFAIQMAASLAAVAAVVVISLKQMPQREALGLTVFLGLFVSPYACDYDLPVLGVALALLLPAIVRRATLLDEALILALAWGASFWGFGMQRMYQYMGVQLTSADNGPSLGGVFLLLLLALVCRILSREPLSAHTSASPAAVT